MSLLVKASEISIPGSRSENSAYGLSIRYSGMVSLETWVLYSPTVSSENSTTRHATSEPEFLCNIGAEPFTCIMRAKTSKIDAEKKVFYCAV